MAGLIENIVYHFTRLSQLLAVVEMFGDNRKLVVMVEILNWSLLAYV
jgi:hypothetical protein